MSIRSISGDDAEKTDEGSKNEKGGPQAKPQLKATKPQIPSPAAPVKSSKMPKKTTPSPKPEPYEMDIIDMPERPPPYEMDFLTLGLPPSKKEKIPPRSQKKSSASIQQLPKTPTEKEIQIEAPCAEPVLQRTASKEPLLPGTSNTSKPSCEPIKAVASLPKIKEHKVKKWYTLLILAMIQVLFSLIFVILACFHDIFSGFIGLLACVTVAGLLCIPLNPHIASKVYLGLGIFKIISTLECLVWITVVCGYGDAVNFDYQKIWFVIWLFITFLFDGYMAYECFLYRKKLTKPTPTIEST